MEPNQTPGTPPPDPGISQVPPQKDEPAAAPPPPFSPALNDTQSSPPPAGPPAPSPSTPLPRTAAQPAMPQPQAGPAPGPVIGDGGMAPPTQQPFIPSDPVVSTPSRRRLPGGRLTLAIAGLVILLVGGASAFYFGYYNNPTVIYSQALSNTGKGYDKLLDYADKSKGKYEKGYSGSGTYKLKAGDFSTDGNAAYKTDGKNSDMTFDFGAATTRINADIRTIQSSGKTPDIYIKAGGIKGVGTMMGMPALDAEFAKLDNQWIAIDHTFIDSLSAASSGDTDSSPGDTTPTREQVLDEARAFGRVNQQYLFTTDEDKAVTKIASKVGRETIDGHKTFHYKVSLDKENVKEYLRAQKDALKDSKLNDWLKENGYDKQADAGFDAVIKSADEIKPGDTYDVWMDTGQRVIYKVRFTAKENPASNYVDVGLDYKGGDHFPLFLSGKSKESGQTATFSFRMDIDTLTGKTDLKIKYAVEGAGSSDFSGDFTMQPNSSTPKITKPDKSISINEVISGFDAAYEEAFKPAPAPPSPSSGPSSSGSSRSTGSNTGGVTLFRDLLGR